MQTVLIRAEAERGWIREAVRGGRLTRLFPGIYVPSEALSMLPDLGRHRLRCVAAMRYLDGDGALSHLTALAVWRLRRPSGDEPIHVTVPSRVRKRASSGIVIHHRRGALHAIRRGALLMTSMAQSIVDSWPNLAARKGTGLVVDALQRKLVTAEELRENLLLRPKLKGAPELRRLITLHAEGCESPLEIWGALEVFSTPEFGGLRRQVPITVGPLRIRLDLFAEEEKVNFELDGAAFHGSQAQRERDLRRDAALATLGILVVRFSYTRLMSEPSAVRLEALAILAARRLP